MKSREPKDRSCCGECHICLDYKDSHQCSDDNCLCHSKAAAEWETRFDAGFAWLYNQEARGPAVKRDIYYELLKTFIRQLLKETQDKTREEEREKMRSWLRIPIKTPVLGPVICNACRAHLTIIRGRYRGSDKRFVCAGCAVENLESIRDNLTDAQQDTITNQNKSEV